MSKRSKQIVKESFLTCLLYIFYFCWWYYFAYIYSKREEYILGLPAWFFYSCVLGLVVINILVFIIIKLFFREINLKSEEKEKR